MSTSRSTTTSIVCLNFLSSSIGLLEQLHVAVDLRAPEPLGPEVLEEVA